MTTPEDRYLRLAELARYSSLSVRTLQRAIAATKRPLPAHHVGRMVLVRQRDFDTWIEQRHADVAAAARVWVRKLVSR